MEVGGFGGAAGRWALPQHPPRGSRGLHGAPDECQAIAGGAEGATGEPGEGVKRGCGFKIFKEVCYKKTYGRTLPSVFFFLFFGGHLKSKKQNLLLEGLGIDVLPTFCTDSCCFFKELAELFSGSLRLIGLFLRL